MAINEKQKRFVDEYLIDLNATQAAIRAGYSPGSEQRASEIGYQLLQKTPVQEYLRQRQQDLQKRTEITQERIMAEYAKIGFADIKSVMKWSPSLGIQTDGDDVIQTNGVMLKDSDELPPEVSASIAEVSQTQQGIKIKMHDKKGALDSMARVLGLFNDKMSIGGQAGNPVVITSASDDELLKIINGG